MAHTVDTSKVRSRLLLQLESAWLDFTRSYAGLSDAELLAPGVTKAWSVRDIIVHVTTWEEEALKHLPGVQDGHRPPRYSVTYGGIDAFNALMTARLKDLSLDEVFKRQAAVHRRLVRLVETTDENHLRSGARFRHRLRLDTYGHYPGHAKAIRRWRGGG